MHTMSAQELKDALDREEDLVLINVLDQGPFEKEHIPNSQNFPVSDEQFERPQ